MLHDQCGTVHVHHVHNPLYITYFRIIQNNAEDMKATDLNTASSSSQGIFVAAIMRILSSADVVAPSTCVMNSVLRRREASCSFS